VVVATGTCSQTETPSLVLSAPAGEAGTLYLLVQTSGDGPATGEVPASVFAQVVRGTDFERWSDRAATVTADAAGRLHFDGVSLMPEPGTHATEPIVLHGVAGCAGQG
jgi:hypothetical protein